MEGGTGGQHNNAGGFVRENKIKRAGPHDVMVK